MSETRNFTIVSCDAGKTGGVYAGKRPGDAAKKAANAIFKAAGGRKKTVVFKIREHQTDIVSSYKATHKKLSPPRQIVRAGKTILISNEVKVEFVGRERA